MGHGEDMASGVAILFVNVVAFPIALKLGVNDHRERAKQMELDDDESFETFLDKYFER